MDIGLGDAGDLDGFAAARPRSSRHLAHWPWATVLPSKPDVAAFPEFLPLCATRAIVKADASLRLRRCGNRQTDSKEDSP
jgi:hypothetical protein